MPYSSRHFAPLVGSAVCALLVSACAQDGAKLRHYEQGTRFLESGQPKNAIIEFRNAVDRDKSWGAAHLRLADAYAAAGQPEAAFREYIRAADLMPDDVEVQLKAVTFLVLVGQYEYARTRVQQVVAKHPSNVDAQILLGNALAGMNDLEGAVEQINDAIELEPGRSGSYMNLGVVKLAQGRRDEAEAAFTQAVESDPASVRAWRALAVFQWSIGNAKAAGTSLQRAYAIDPQDVTTNRALATYCLATGRAGDAEQYLKRIADRAGPPAQLELATYYVHQQRPADARRLLEPLTTRRDLAAAAEMRLAALEYAAGERAGGHRLLDAVLTREPNHAPALVMKARWLLEEGQPEVALERARAAVMSNPRLIAGYYVRGVIEAETHRTADAIKSFSEILRLNSRAAVAHIQLSRLHLARQQLENAVLYGEEAVQNAPASLDARLARVRAWLARGDTSRAEGELAMLETRAASVAAVHVLRGLLETRAGRHQRARTAFERALQLDSGSVEAVHALSRLELQQRSLGSARRRVNVALAQHPDNTDLLLLSAKIDIAAGAFPDAEKTLRRVIAIDPVLIEPIGLLREIYSSQDRVAQARRDFEAIARQQPAAIGAQLMAAVLADADGDAPAATRLYRDVVSREPRAVLAANNLAWLYAQGNEHHDDALRLAETAVEHAPGNAEIRDTLGWLYLRRGRPTEAIRHFEQAITLSPHNATYHHHAGLAWLKSGETGKARDSLLRALELDERLEDARRTLESLPTR